MGKTKAVNMAYLFIVELKILKISAKFLLYEPKFIMFAQTGGLKSCGRGVKKGHGPDIPVPPFQVNATPLPRNVSIQQKLKCLKCCKRY